MVVGGHGRTDGVGDSSIGEEDVGRPVESGGVIMQCRVGVVGICAEVPGISLSLVFCSCN